VFACTKVVWYLIPLKLNYDLDSADAFSRPNILEKSRRNTISGIVGHLIELPLNALELNLDEIVVPHQQWQPLMTRCVLLPGIFGQLLELVHEVIDVLAQCAERFRITSFVIRRFCRLVSDHVSPVKRQPVDGTDLLSPMGN
jgi:hypothetical protein